MLSCCTGGSAGISRSDARRMDVSRGCIQCWIYVLKSQYAFGRVRVLPLLLVLLLFLHLLLLLLLYMEQDCRGLGQFL